MPIRSYKTSVVSRHGDFRCRFVSCFLGAKTGRGFTRRLYGASGRLPRAGRHFTLVSGPASLLPPLHSRPLGVSSMSLRRVLFCFVSALALAATSSCKGEPEGAEIALFNGKDLTGWKVTECET